MITSGETTAEGAGRARPLDAAGASAGGRDLPDEPLIRIRPEQKPLADKIAEVWSHRELLYFLMWRDLKARYKQTALGAAWVILQPALSTVIFTIFMGRFVRVPSEGVPYPLFAYGGLLTWAFISNSILSGSHSIVASARVIDKVYFPRLLVPLSMVGVRLVDFLIASAVLVALMAHYGVSPTWRSALLAAVPMALAVALAAALGVLTAALNAKYRDTGTALPVALQLWMFASPVIYPSSVVPARWLRAYELNPLVGVVGGFRDCLFGGPLAWRALAASAAVTLALLLASLLVFRRMEDDFAEVV